MKTILIVSVFLISFSSFAQERYNFGFGGNIGYKCITNEVGFIGSVRMQQLIDLYIALDYGKYSGFGYSVGINGYLFKKKGQPFIGINFNYQDGSKFSTGESSDLTFYRVLEHSCLVYSAGVRWTVPFDDINYNRFITVTPYFSYRDLITDVNLIRVEGPEKPEMELSVIKRINSGFGGGVSIIYFFGDRISE